MISKRNEKKYRNLFDKYCELDDKQQDLYSGQIYLPIENKIQFNELQVKKITILDEMENCFICKPTTLSQLVVS